MFQGANIVVKAGLGLLPGGGFITAGYELLQLAGKTVSEHIEARNERRYGEFIKCLLEEGTDPAAALHLDIDDFHALLNACLADLENQKAGLYGALAVAIGTGQVPPELRRVLMLYLRDLSFAQLEKLRQMWITTKFYVKGDYLMLGQGRRKHPIEFLNEGGLSVINSIDREALASRLLISEDDGRVKKLGEALLSACYSKAQLEPASIGESGMKTGFLQVIASDLNDLRSRDLTYAIGAEAWDNDIVAGTGHETLDFQMPFKGTERSYVLIVHEGFDGTEGKLSSFVARHQSVKAVVLFLGAPIAQLLGQLNDPVVLFDDGVSDPSDVGKAVLAKVLELWK